MSNTIHTTTQRGERRSVERLKKEPIFDSNVLHYLTAGAVLHQIHNTDDAADAVRWSLCISGFVFNKPSPL